MGPRASGPRWVVWGDNAKLTFRSTLYTLQNLYFSPCGTILSFYFIFRWRGNAKDVWSCDLITRVGCHLLERYGATSREPTIRLNGDQLGPSIKGVIRVTINRNSWTFQLIVTTRWRSNGQSKRRILFYGRRGCILMLHHWSNGRDLIAPFRSNDVSSQPLIAIRPLIWRLRPIPL